MEGCPRAEWGEDCCRWGHLTKNLLRFGLTEIAAASGYTEYDETILMDVEILRLVRMVFDVIASDANSCGHSCGIRVLQVWGQ